MMFPSVGNILNACAIIYMVYFPESSWLILLVGVSNCYPLIGSKHEPIRLENLKSNLKPFLSWNVSYSN